MTTKNHPPEPPAEQEDRLADLAARLTATDNTIRAMSARIDALERELEELRHRSDVEIPEDILMAISAAVSAYLGNSGKVRAVRFHRHQTWAQQGRRVVQVHHGNQM